MSFQENLKYYRELAGYNQAKEFAQDLGIPYTRYISYESKGSEPKYELLCTIAHKLNVTLEQLLDYHLDDFTKAKNIVEKNKGFIVHETTDGHIILQQKFNAAIEETISHNLKASKSIMNIHDIKKICTLTFSDKNDFINFIYEFIPFFENNPQKMLNFNTCINEYIHRYNAKKTVRKNIGLDMMYWDIEKLPSATKEEVLTDKPIPSENKKQLANFLKNFMHSKKEFDIPSLIFSPPIGYASIFANVKKIFF